MRQADKYIGYPQSSKNSALSRWRNRSSQWLKRNLPDSGLALDLSMAGSIGRSYESPRRSDLATVQRSLKVLAKAQHQIGFLNVKKTSIPQPKNAKNIFIVHGHNDALKATTARLVERLGLNPVILHEQPNKGRTIIEKFFDYADVAFAIVLLTGDDLGNSRTNAHQKLQPRSRQNVILELGFFLGKLGRERVVAIYQDEVELPSDYSGVLFIPFDEGGSWKYQLTDEMKAAGLRIDKNRI